MKIFTPLRFQRNKKFSQYFCVSLHASFSEIYLRDIILVYDNSSNVKRSLIIGLNCLARGQYELVNRIIVYCKKEKKKKP